MYYAQTLMGMDLLGFQWVDFVVWTQHKTKIERFPFNKEYYEREVLEKAEDWYMKRFLPEAVVAIQQERDWTPQVK